MKDNFDETLVGKLKEKLPPSAIKTRQAFGGENKQLSYLEGWYVQEQLNEVFGFGNWSQEVTALYQVGEPFEVTKSGKNGSYKNLVVVWNATVRLTVNGVVREDVGVGVGEGTNLAAIQEKTIKEAVTDGVKRAAKSLGYRFGLALYDKEQANVMSPEEERLSNQKLLANSFINMGDYAGLRVWYKNMRDNLKKGAEKYPNLKEQIDDIIKSVEDFLKSDPSPKDDPKIG